MAGGIERSEGPARGYGGSAGVLGAVLALVMLARPTTLEANGTPCAQHVYGEMKAEGVMARPCCGVGDKSRRTNTRRAGDRSTSLAGRLLAGTDRKKRASQGIPNHNPRPPSRSLDPPRLIRSEWQVVPSGVQRQRWGIGRGTNQSQASQAR
ncbi:hypothetical protein BJ912DRAFT_1005041 [Pholiota molesta]|nr:hypothetical protein BJ912DRAFT_1005041 [Pholiota molesta]